jgi:hypothetical protein
MFSIACVNANAGALRWRQWPLCYGVSKAAPRGTRDRSAKWWYMHLADQRGASSTITLICLHLDKRYGCMKQVIMSRPLLSRPLA